MLQRHNAAALQRHKLGMLEKQKATMLQRCFAMRRKKEKKTNTGKCAKSGRRVTLVQAVVVVIVIVLVLVSVLVSLLVFLVVLVINILIVAVLIAGDCSWCCTQPNSYALMHIIATVARS